MTLNFNKDLFVRIHPHAKAPRPDPQDSGFSFDRAYRVLGIQSFSESSECYCILANDNDEIWFISNRHLRVVGIFSAQSVSSEFTTKEVEQIEPDPVHIRYPVEPELAQTVYCSRFDIL